MQTDRFRDRERNREDYELIVEQMFVNKNLVLDTFGVLLLILKINETTNNI